MDCESSRYDKLESILLDRNSEPCAVPLEYLRRITNDFSDKELLGEGGFGRVYKGVLQNGKMVAVKKLQQLKPDVQDRQFENEVYHLMKLKHPNIVRFVGYCYETKNECVEYNGEYVFAEIQQRLLCLEYLPNGSLDGQLSDESSGLDWHTRYKIIKGVCHGLHYLHEECKALIYASIIHLDLKPANILLDENMVPKVADFGLSRLFDDKKTQTRATTLAGSFGYMAPEYICGHLITTKADIYSLGVIILEIVTGSKVDPFNSNISTSCQDFLEPVLKNWRNRSHAAPSETDCKQIQICLEIGISCIKINRNERPTAREIIERLNIWESTDFHVNNEQTSTSDQVQLMEQTPSVLTCEETSSSDQVTVEDTWDEFLEFAKGVALRTVSLIFEDEGVKNLLVNLYRKDWLDGNVTEYLVATFADYFADFKKFYEKRSFEIFVETCLEETIVVYIDLFLTQKIHIREDTICRMRLDEAIFMDYFGEYINMTEVESRVQVMADLRDLASAESVDSFTLIYTNILKHQPDCPPEVVRELVTMREGIPGNDAEEVVRECKEIYENSLVDGNPAKPGFVFGKLKCFSTKKDK